MNCMYCKRWFKAPENNRIYEKNDEETMIHKRFCSQTKKFVSERDECTEYFVSNPTFWCKKEENWIHVLACLERRTSANTCIWGCGQRDDILDVIRALESDEPPKKESRLIK